MGKRAEYLVTPEKGRVNKSRQVPAFTVKVGERHGDLDFLEDQISFALRKWAKLTDIYTIIEMTGVASVYTARTYRGGQTGTPIATCTVEAVEKDS